MVDLSEHDDGKRLVLKVSDTIRISLRENPSTGYYWALISQPAALVHRDNTFVNNPDGNIGSGGIRTFTFEAAQTGSAELRFRLWRGFPDPGNNSTVQFAFDIL